LAAIFVVAVVLAAWWMTGLANNNGSTNVAANSGGFYEPQMGHVSAPSRIDPAQLEGQAVSAVMGENGTQSLDLTIVGDTMSYKPNVIKVKQGAQVRLNIGIEGRDPGCGRYVVFKGLGAHAIAEPGKVTTAEFTPTQAGVYEINCGMDMMEPGYLVVAQ
jgi:plastocyanin